MKRNTLRLGSVLLALCMLFALLPGTALAVNLDDFNVDCSYTLQGVQGQYYQWYWNSLDGEDIFDFNTQSEYYPDGLAFHKSSNDTFVVEGTPNESGTFWVTATCSTADHDFTVELTISVESGYDKPEMYVSESLSGKVGTAVNGWSWGTPDGENISNLYIDQGSLPNGLYIPDPGSNAFQICGTPNSAGSSSCTVTVETFDDIYYVEISWTIATAEPNFEITKSPTSEYTSDGGKATFIAAANNYNYVEWLLLVNGNIVATFGGNSNTSYNGATVITYNDSGREYLVLQNIPASMNGYRVQARFTNSSKGSILTDSCNLSVDPPPLSAPVISVAPSAVSETVGKNVTLSVVASDPNGGSLQYQWYSNSVADFRGAVSISGANQSSYTPPQTVGTVYYYCSIVSVKGGYSSAATNTTPVGVTYKGAEATPTPAPSTQPSASPAVSPSAEPTASPAVTPAADSKTSGSFSLMPVLLGVLIVLIAAVLVCQLIYISKKNKGEAVPLVKWDCPECGTRNKAGSRFCSECGAKNPRLKQ